MELGLKNKVAMVGGASKGLGFAVARALTAEGAQVSIASRDKDCHHARGRHDHARHRRSGTGRGRGSQQPGRDRGVARGDDGALWRGRFAVRQYRRPPAGAALAFDDEGWQAAFDLLLMSVIRTVRLVVPSMRARGGGAILVGTSLTVKEPIANLALSNVLRSGVTSLAKTLSLELAPDKIRVNTLIPGRIATDRLRQLDEINAKRSGIALEDQQARAAATIPLGRYGAPDDFGRMGAFLLSDAASYVHRRVGAGGRRDD